MVSLLVVTNNVKALDEEGYEDDEDYDDLDEEYDDLQGVNKKKPPPNIFFYFRVFS